MNHSTHGFTLIELSIVLVIIGLIVSGVLVGQDLIRTAGVRAQVTQIEQYNTAVNTFRGKYDCLPGDCEKATTFFGTSWPGWALSNQNGDGNGLILDDSYSPANTFPFRMTMEVPIVFAHLFLAGMADCCNSANLNTTFFGGGTQSAGAVYPATKIGAGGFVPMYMNGRNGWWLGMGNSVPASPCGGGNTMDYLNMQAGGPCSSVGGLLTPQQARAFDAKVDDGSPITGNVYVAWVFGGDNHIHPTGAYWVNYHCIANTTPPTYDLSYGLPVCNLFSIMQ